MEWYDWYMSIAVLFIVAVLWFGRNKHKPRDEFDFPVHDESYKDDE